MRRSRFVVTEQKKNHTHTKKHKEQHITLQPLRSSWVIDFNRSMFDVHDHQQRHCTTVHNMNEWTFKEAHSIDFLVECNLQSNPPRAVHWCALYLVWRVMHCCFYTELQRIQVILLKSRRNYCSVLCEWMNELINIWSVLHLSLEGLIIQTFLGDRLELISSQCKFLQNKTLIFWGALGGSPCTADTT